MRPGRSPVTSPVVAPVFPPLRRDRRVRGLILSAAVSGGWSVARIW
jgi:hypothetical protein